MVEMLVGAGIMLVGIVFGAVIMLAGRNDNGSE